MKILYILYILPKLCNSVFGKFTIATQLFWYFIILFIISLYLLIFVNCAHRTIHNTLYTIAHLERLLFSAIVHCLHPLVLPPAICCSSNIAKKAKKESFWNPAFQKAFYQAVLSIFCCLCVSYLCINPMVFISPVLPCGRTWQCY